MSVERLPFLYVSSNSYAYTRQARCMEWKFVDAGHEDGCRIYANMWTQLSVNFKLELSIIQSRFLLPEIIFIQIDSGLSLYFEIHIY